MSRSLPILSHNSFIDINEKKAEHQQLYCYDETSKQHTDDITLLLIQLLAENIKELQDHKNRIKKIRNLADNDVEELIDSLLHNMNSSDKEMYKTGAKFMKNILSKIILV